MSPRLVQGLLALVLVVACTPPTSLPADPTTTLRESQDGIAAASTTSAPGTVATVPGTEELPGPLRDQLAGLVAVTQEVRGLPFLQPPTVTVVTDEELAERVADILTDELEGIERDEALLELLGLIEQGVDLRRLYTDLYAEQVAGFYDGDTKELVVPARSEEFSLLQSATVVHELTHALTDQHFSFHDTFTELIDSQRFDEASAYQALIEGDAVFTELQYILTLSQDDRLELVGESLAIDQTVFQAAPRFLQELLIFPYVTGQLFVEDLHGRGGGEAVARAYQQGPASTEQIYRPSDYPGEAPLRVALPQVTLEGYT
ncbi:MAG: hypothetical protein ACRDVM_08110, partial [Acidimicrobiia bacterium]